MKTKLYLLALTLIAGAGGVSQAQINREFPYVAPIYCPDSVIERPDGANVFYRSESCKTIYVLPPATGALDYKVVLGAMGDNDCDELDQLNASKKRLNDNRVVLEDEVAKPGISDAKIKTLDRQLEIVQRSLNNLDKSIKYLAALEGATMAVRLSAQHSEEVDRFERINTLLMRQGTNIEAAQIAESYVSFDVGSEATPATRPAIIRTNIPGIEVRGTESAPQSDSRIMNGGLSGKVVLGVNAICNMRKQQKVASIYKIAFEPGEMEAYLPANLTYTVPVLSSYSYKAWMNYETVIKGLLKQLETKPDQFTVNFGKQFFINEIAKNNSGWEFTALELQDRGADSKDLMEIDQREKEAVFAGWSREIAEQLVKLGILEKMTPIPVAAPPAGTVEEIFHRQVCQTKKFVGIRYSHRCWEEPYRVVRVRGGEADSLIEEVRSLKLNFSTEVKYSQPIYRPHTSTFKYRKMN